MYRLVMLYKEIKIVINLTRRTFSLKFSLLRSNRTVSQLHAIAFFIYVTLFHIRW